ncbi:MAG: hypothetical protein KFF46_04350 [Desulfobacterales bacterium]|nr:hypothetical protein [Desulfobacterales bacterium]
MIEENFQQVGVCQNPVMTVFLRFWAGKADSSRLCVSGIYIAYAESKKTEGLWLVKPRKNRVVSKMTGRIAEKHLWFSIAMTIVLVCCFAANGLSSSNSAEPVYENRSARTEGLHPEGAGQDRQGFAEISYQPGEAEFFQQPFSPGIELAAPVLNDDVSSGRKDSGLDQLVVMIRSIVPRPVSEPLVMLISGLGMAAVANIVLRRKNADK